MLIYYLPLQASTIDERLDVVIATASKPAWWTFVIKPSTSQPDIIYVFVFNCTDLTSSNVTPLISSDELQLDLKSTCLNVQPSNDKETK